MAPTDKPAAVKGKTDTNNDGKVNSLDDLNGDGVASKADKTLRQDTLSQAYLETNYETAARIVNGAPSLKKLFTEAVAGGWTQAQFTAALQNTEWYNSQESEYARKGWLAKAAGGNEWNDQLMQARDAVQRTAASMGAEIPEKDLDTWAEKYIMGGWSVSARQGMMLDSLASYTDISRGGAAKVASDLRALASDNGVGLTEKWLNDVAVSIAKGESTQVDYESWIREQAAARYPMYGDKIKAGVSVKALASPYMTRMQDILEIPSEQIDLNDPYINQALGMVNEKGEQVPMNYTEFENKLRSDPRWESTKNGKNSLMNMANKMSEAWGFQTDNYFG